MSMFRSLSVSVCYKWFHTRSLALSKLPSSNPAPNFEASGNISLSECWKPWIRSLKPERLRQLQDELVSLMTPEIAETSGVSVRGNTIKIDAKNWINELIYEVTNNSKGPTKEVVFIHGYGASLGCFARNFEFYKQFVGLEDNYKIHYLDNITFGLSSNPKIGSRLVNHIFIKRAAQVKLNDTEEGSKESKLHKKYYKLVDSYEVDAKKFESYRQEFRPILNDIEDYYLSAIEKWRLASGIKQIDFLVGHSYGGYWSSSYVTKHPDAVKNLILLSPVGVERQVHSINNTDFHDKQGKVTLKPTLDPSSTKFLTRLPILSRRFVSTWYNVFPFLPRVLKYLGPWGYRMYHNLWFSKLYKINRVRVALGRARGKHALPNNPVYGSPRECHTIIEYLYNSTTKGSYSDIYIKYILSPSTTSKHPLYDKLVAMYTSQHERNNKLTSLKIHFLYGEYDFMNAEAGQMLVREINTLADSDVASFETVEQGGHNLYIDNPFDTNRRLFEIIESANC